MTDKELRRLSRLDLVEIIYELQKKEENYKRKIAELEARLEERDLKISEAGSIAEAAMKLNDVFVHAQKAADQYLEEIQKIRNSVQEEAEQKAEEILADARKQAEQIAEEADQDQ